MTTPRQELGDRLAVAAFQAYRFYPSGVGSIVISEDQKARMSAGILAELDVIRGEVKKGTQ